MPTGLGQSWRKQGLMGTKKGPTTASHIKASDVGLRPSPCHPPTPRRASGKIQGLVQVTYPTPAWGTALYGDRGRGLLVAVGLGYRLLLGLWVDWERKTGTQIQHPSQALS